MVNKILTPKDVIENYPALTLSEGTLANWRVLKKGPRFFKVSRKIVYKASDIEEYLFRNPVQTLDSVA
ncbi:MAG: DNA-binding protein [Deltaproteobacteria bacterium]|jgi:hypothetical protein|nr:DNA-binding protein [Deltaproteobacteria bacterium]